MRIGALLGLLLLVQTAFAAKSVDLTVEWTFQHVVQGYDHDTKIFVYVDGVFSGESSVYKQTQKARYTLPVPRGSHDIRIEAYALYEGNWELHSKANDYSVDAIYENRLSFKSNASISLVFDISTESSNVRLSGLKVPSSDNFSELQVTWTFTNVQAGFDHENKMMLFVDGQKMDESEVFRESQVGKMIVRVPKGSHTIAIENYALYGGQWELYIRENDYSLDAYFSKNIPFSKRKHKIHLVFDIESASATVEIDGKASE